MRHAHRRPRELASCWIRARRGNARIGRSHEVAPTSKVLHASRWMPRSTTLFFGRFGEFPPLQRCSCTSSPSVASTLEGKQEERQGPKRMLVVDANALVYRAYYAFHHLKLSSKWKGREGKRQDRPARGETDDQDGDDNTGALFGFVRMLLMLLEIKPLPDYVSVVFDSPGPTFRHELFPAYKRNRDKSPADLKHKLMPQVREVVKAMQLCTLEAPGYEADDIIATLCRTAPSMQEESQESDEGGIEIDIASPDKDFFQLLAPGVRLLRPSRKTYNKSITYEPYTERSFQSEFAGLDPNCFPDFLALVGDSADNVQGVRGIGPKTATKLLLKYGSLDGVIANASSITGSKVARKALEDPSQVESAKLSKELVVLCSTVDLLVRHDQGWWETNMAFKRPEDGGKKTLELFEQFDFRTLTSRVERLWQELDDSQLARGSTREEDSEIV